MSDLRPIKNSPDNGIEYFSYTCSKCGQEARNTYCEPHRTVMLEKRLCYTCNHWREFEEKNFPNRDKLTIIAGAIYTPGNRTSGDFRGMAGRRFDIEYVEPSVHAGKRITTFDLWYGSEIPSDIRAKFPDTAKFLNDAERALAGDITCFNQSTGKSEPYPLPKTIGIG